MRSPQGSKMPQKVKVFRLNQSDLCAGYDLASVKSAYLAESGMANGEAFDEEEEVPQDAMKTVRIYPNLYAKESSTFQEELARMVAEGVKGGVISEFRLNFVRAYPCLSTFDILAWRTPSVSAMR
jgi:hypothetical protein